MVLTEQSSVVQWCRIFICTNLSMPIVVFFYTCISCRSIAGLPIRFIYISYHEVLLWMKYHFWTKITKIRAGIRKRKSFFYTQHILIKHLFLRERRDKESAILTFINAYNRTVCHREWLQCPRFCKMSDSVYSVQYQIRYIDPQSTRAICQIT